MIWHFDEVDILTLVAPPDIHFFLIPTLPPCFHFHSLHRLQSLRHPDSVHASVGGVTVNGIGGGGDKVLELALPKVSFSTCAYFEIKVSPNMIFFLYQVPI